MVNLPPTVDVVVIGAGVGGLTAALALVRSGLSVLLLERHHHVGGYCTSFRRRGFLFDAAVHHLSAAAPKANLGMLLARLGVTIPLIPLDPMDTLVFPDEEVTLPSGFLAIKESLSERYPSDAEGIKDLLRHMRSIYRDIRRGGPWREPDGTYHDLLSRYLKDPRCLRALGGQWGYIGLPPDQISARAAVMVMGSYLLEGAYYVRGGCHGLPEAMREAFLAQGGVLALSTSATAILCRSEGVRAVVAGEQEIHCKAVVAGADAWTVLGQMVSPALAEEHLGALRSLSLSTSAYVLYLGLGPGADLTRLPRGFYFSPLVPGQWACVANPTALDPTLAPEGCHILTLMAPAAAEPGLTRAEGQARKEQASQALLDLACSRSPGLEKHVLVSVAASPATLARYTGNQGGCLYGWAMTPDQTGQGRLSPLTPIPGLFLAGHWTLPGPGVHGVAVSGDNAARLVAAHLRRASEHIG